VPGGRTTCFLVHRKGLAIDWRHCFGLGAARFRPLADAQMRWVVPLLLPSSCAGGEVANLPAVLCDHEAEGGEP
jgi:hypothetical protein